MLLPMVLHSVSHPSFSPASADSLYLYWWLSLYAGDSDEDELCMETLLILICLMIRVLQYFTSVFLELT